MSPAALIPDRRRRAGAAVLAVLSVAGLVVLGVLVRGDTRPTALDRTVDGWVADHLGYGIALSLADIGGPKVLVPVTAVLAAVFATCRWRHAVVLVVLAPLVAVALTDLALKPLFGRTLDGGLSYPSGHTTGAAGVAFAVAVVALGPGRRCLRRAVALASAALCGLVVLACALGLVAAGYHYFTDTVGGALLAITTVLGLALATDAVTGRARRGEGPVGAVATPPAADTWHDRRR